jgi:hypothetical protein
MGVCACVCGWVWVWVWQTWIGSVGLDKDHGITVHDWSQAGKLVASGKIGPSRVFGLAFCPDKVFVLPDF